MSSFVGDVEHKVVEEVKEVIDHEESDDDENEGDVDDCYEGISGHEMGVPSVDFIDVIPNSMCMYCHGRGKTRVLIHEIPYFREIVISSFRCDDCGYTDTEISFGGEIQIQGCKYLLR